MECDGYFLRLQENHNLFDDRRACESPKLFAKIPTPTAFDLGVPHPIVSLRPINSFRHGPQIALDKRSLE